MFSKFGETDEILKRNINSIANIKTTFKHKVGTELAISLIQLMKQATKRKLNKGIITSINLTTQRILDIMTQIK